MDLGLRTLLLIRLLVSQHIANEFGRQPNRLSQIGTLSLLIFVFSTLKSHGYENQKIQHIQQLHQEHRKRWLELHQTESVKNLNETYRRFYDRHDTAACFYLSKFYMNLNDLEQFNFSDPNQKLKIVDSTDQAKKFCLSDEVTRREALSSIRNAIRLIGERKPLTIQRGLATSSDETTR